MFDTRTLSTPEDHHSARHLVTDDGTGERMWATMTCQSPSESEITDMKISDD